MSCGVFTGNTLLLVAAPATYGDVPAGTGTEYDALPILQGSTIELAGDDETLDYLRGSFTPSVDIPGGAYWTLKLDMPLYGGGVDGTLQPLPADKILRASGMVKQDAFVVPIGTGITGDWAVGDAVENASSTVFGYVAGVDTSAAPHLLLVYNATPGNAPVSGDAITVAPGGTATLSADPYTAFVYAYTSDCDSTANNALKWFYQNILCVASGARSSVDFSFEVNKTAKMTVNLTGLYQAPADATKPSDKLPPNLVPPNCVGMGLKLGSYAPAGVDKLELKQDADVQVIDDLNASDGYSGVDIVGRMPMCSFEMDAAATLVAHDPFAAWQAGTTTQLVARLGSVAGNRFHLVLPNGQPRRPKFGDKNKRLRYSREFKLTGGVDNELFFFYY